VDLQEEASKEATEALRTLGVELKGHNQEQQERIEGLNKQLEEQKADREKDRGAARTAKVPAYRIAHQSLQS